MDPPKPEQMSCVQSSNPNGKESSKSKFSIVKSLENSSLTVPTIETNNKYYQIAIPEGPIIRIYFVNQSIIRVRLCFDKNPLFDEQSYALVMTAWEDRFDDVLKNIRRRIKPLINVSFQEVETESEGKYYYFQTNQLNGKIYKNPYGLEIFNKSGVSIFKDLRGRAYKRDTQGRIYHYCQIDETNDFFYGFGENTGKLNKAGARVRLAPQDSLGYNAETTSPLYKHIPFYIKVNQKHKHAVGVFYNNQHEAVFDMGSERSGYWPRYSFYSADGGDVDFFIINGPSMKRVIQRYTDLTGKTALAPIQSLGYIGSTMFYAELQEKCDEAILDFVKKCKKQNIPISNFHLSSGYTLSENKITPKRYVFTWNGKKFPNPSQFFQSMRDLGVEVAPNIKPGILTTHYLYQQFASNQGFIKDPQNQNIPYVDRWWGGDGSFVDFTGKKGREIWKKHLKQQVIMKGTTSIWNDNNQYESIDNRGAICSAEGQCGTVNEFKTVQALMMNHIADEAIKEANPEVRPYLVTRGGCAGLQRYASSWSGDNYTNWETLRANISTVLNMGLSGVANYGCDIGGFWGPAPSAQLLLRWVQHGIFQPRFSIHSCNSDNTVTQPWMFPKYSALIAKTIRFRYVLLPYLYSLLYFSHIKGRPIMRPLVYEFQDLDFEACSENSTQFMLGPFMLVANVLQAMKNLCNSAPSQKQATDLTQFPLLNLFVKNCLELGDLNSNSPYTYHHATHLETSNSQFGYQQIYLPKGCNWYSWNGRQKYSGGSTIVGKVGVESIPIFVKDRSIIPLAIKFGSAKGAFDICQMNRQHVTGVYIKIAYDNEGNESLKGQWRTKNALQFIMFKDNGKSPLNQQNKKEGTSQRIIQNRLNPQIPADSNYLQSKIVVRNPEIKQVFNPNIVIIDILRQGNIDDDNICTIDIMILQVKSVDKAPIWITINDSKCKQFLYEADWAKWKAPVLEKIKSQTQSQILIEEPGCWYYDHEKGSAVLKIHKNIVKPICQQFRNIHIRICKDNMIQFKKQYGDLAEQIEDNSQKLKDQVMVEQDEIEEIISGEQVKKVKERKRIIAKDNK